MQSLEKGQIMLIVVLVMVTALTVALSVAARSITNTRSSEEDANFLNRLFPQLKRVSEKSLTNNSAVTGSFSNNAKYSTTTVVTVDGLAFSFKITLYQFYKMNQHDLWLSTYPGYTNQWSGEINVDWGQTTDSCNANTAAAIEVIVFSGSTGNPQTKKYFYDPCSNRALTNNFANVLQSSYTVGGQTYAYESPTISITSGLFAAVIPLYAPTNIAIKNCGCNGGIPAQGTLIQSVGTAANTVRKIQTYRYYPQLPTELLQYSFFIPK